MSFDHKTRYSVEKKRWEPTNVWIWIWIWIWKKFGGVYHKGYTRDQIETDVD